ncbi:hypothetical protein AMATHDRAFT_5291 [Amanita thiersii Skay4041]|uniref:UBA domain-containing protein n=1 Tax=Amanita thiersii Skay4041 TaxID=703135 RepID=A0A2A9NED2_9AGAR|nr:hypothetical protein AMATHDRAFT_5291 [Amanita thiersii Skay4041]
MSDAFADLWNSSTPNKPVPPRTLGSTTPSQAPPRRTQQDLFSLLSSNNPSTSSLNPRPSPQPRSITPAQPKDAIAKGHATANDAFGDLLGNSISNGSQRLGSLTIAERAAQVEKQRSAALHKQNQVAKSDTSTWQGLDSLAGSSSFTSPQTKTPANTLYPVLKEDAWGFGRATQPQTNTVPLPSQTSALDDDWGLDDFGSSSTTASAPSKMPSVSSTTPNHSSQLLWDLDEFANSAPKQEPSEAPGQIRLGNDTDSLLQEDNDDDDILGVLGKPVNSIQQPSQANPRVPSPVSQSQNTGSHKPAVSRPVSPLPHILGQLVEMGFSVQQARIALAATDTGLDIEGALENLISNGAASSLPALPPRRSPLPHSPTDPRNSLKEVETTHNRQRSASSLRENDREGNLHDQADKLLAQASEIGLTVFNKASLFWREGKERVQKAYEERAVGASSSGALKKPAVNTPGRPKWMKEVDVNTNENWSPVKETFRDETDSHFVSQRSSNSNIPSRPRVPSTRPSVEKARVPESTALSEERPVYVSPWRRGKTKPQVETSEPLPPKAPSVREPSPIRAIPRVNIVSATQSAILSSARHKERGSEKFKLGQYGDAETAYSSAISTLPESHLLLVPLFNNRALTRLKTGDYAGAIEDASAAISIIGVGYHPARELPVSQPEEGADVDLADGLVKALRRRAEAWEGREKWEEAGKDWELLVTKEWAKANMHSEAIRGAGRCRRMLQPSITQSNGPSPVPRQVKHLPARQPVLQVPAQPSEALAKLRLATDAAEAEDQARHELKDSVDAKLIAWKAGKENNIRALLASLDTVLWPELCLPKVGMAELVSSAQVKIRYTKTIAKLHPDKLNVSNSTLEQRMLANSVFGTLNEAWNAFKQ